jgi:hypothetical protein
MRAEANLAGGVRRRGLRQVVRVEQFRLGRIADVPRA